MPTNTPAPISALEQGPQIGQILLLLLYLALILAGAFFVTRMFSRVAQRGSIFTARLGKGAMQHLKLIDRLSLDRERCFVLLEADGKRYLVGITSNAITLLEKSDAPPPEEQPAQPAGLSFRELLQGWRKQGKNDNAPS